MAGPVRTLRPAVAYGLAALIFSGGALADPPPEGAKMPAMSQAASPPPIQSPPADEQSVAPSDSPPAPDKPSSTQGDAAVPGKLEPVAPSQATTILGKKVKGPDGKDIVGAIVDILVDGQGRPRAALIDFGGYMGVGSRKIAVDWNLLTFRPDDPLTPVTLGLDRAEIQAAPEYKNPTQPAEVVEAPPVSTTPGATTPAAAPPPDDVESHPN